MDSRAKRAVVAFVILTLVAALFGNAPATAAGSTVVAVSVTGNAHVSSDKILSAVQTKVGQPLDQKQLQADNQAIFQLGYFTDVLPPLVTQRPTGVAVTFRVVENPVITKIDFTGNTHVPSDTLLALMDTAPGQVFNSNTFHEDVLKINSYYDKIGYGGQVPTHVKNLDLDAKTGSLTLDIQEGLTVKNVTVTGDTLVPAPVVASHLETKPGMTWSQELESRDCEAIGKYYDTLDLERGFCQGGIDPATVDLKNGTVDVKYEVDVARVAAIEITGNTKTKDYVIRRELRLRPGMVITQSALRRDYERLNNTGFFSKVDVSAKPGPDPSKPQDVTLVWKVTEERTGQAIAGVGYSGGANGEGLVGNIGYTQNNINGTGNGASVQFQRGARLSLISASVSVPYLGNTPKLEKYSFGASVFNNVSSYLYPVYSVANPAPNPAGTPLPTPTATPVSIYQQTTGQTALSGPLANYDSRSAGVTLSMGRRFSDYVRGSLGVNVQRVFESFTAPAGYVLINNPTVLNLPTQNGITGQLLPGSTATVQSIYTNTIPSIASVSGTTPYSLRSVVLGMVQDTRDDVFNPRRGWDNTVSYEISNKALGSDFDYTKTILDLKKFWPVLKASTFGIHGEYGTSTGAIPPSAVYTLGEQELSGYTDVFYGTDMILGQAELRFPISHERKVQGAIFAETGGTRLRGAEQYSGNLLVPSPLANYQFHSDVGFGVRFDLPQLGLHTIRLDFAVGQNGGHVSFAIGQKF
ncbi:MAG TPA: POTRA domain-containing protein [Candidatus Dormibacteraeota bacterium]|nr:POTRA domain-containing protein [Candidatus Dormibacteraeota bacterium]